MAAFIWSTAREPTGRPAALARITDKIFRLDLRGVYERGLDWALGAGPVMLFVLLATIVLNVFLFAIVPKGFFPPKTTGQMIGGLADRPDELVQDDQRQDPPALANIIGRESPRSQNGRGLRRNNAAGGFMIVGLKAAEQEKGGAAAVIARLRPKLARGLGREPVPEPGAGCPGWRTAEPTPPIQYTLESDNLADLPPVGEPKLSEAMKTQPALADVNTRPAGSTAWRASSPSDRDKGRAAWG